MLIIEPRDEPRRSLAELLRSQGYEVVDEADSDAGAGRIMQREPDMVLMGETASKIGGEDTLTVLRRLTRSPIVVVGDGGEMAIIRTLISGADLYVSRPIKNRELLTRLRALLRRANPE